MADVNINLFKKIEENVTETVGFPDGYLLVSVNGKLQGIDPNNIGAKTEWVLQFIDTNDVVLVYATPDNIVTFGSGSGTNVGDIEVSTDGSNYSPLTFPFTPSTGFYWFKRSISLMSGVYTISE